MELRRELPSTVTFFSLLSPSERAPLQTRFSLVSPFSRSTDAGANGVFAWHVASRTRGMILIIASSGCETFRRKPHVHEPSTRGTTAMSAAATDETFCTSRGSNWRIRSEHTGRTAVNTTVNKTAKTTQTRSSDGDANFYSCSRVSRVCSAVTLGDLPNRAVWRARYPRASLEGGHDCRLAACRRF